MDVEKRPVLTGLVALVAVALVVGLVAGLAILAGTRIVGLGGGATTASADGSPTSGETLDLPEPTPTEEPSAPLVTLLPGGGEAGKSAKGDSEQKSRPKRKSQERPKKEKPEKSVISLSASQLSVASMGRIDLTGTFPGGEGAVLQVQRREGGTWEDFPVTVSVSNGTFSTYVQSGDPGPNEFRVKDTDSPRTSNPVKVEVG